MTSLRRTLRFRDLVLITVGATIGSGIYLVPNLVLRQTGSQSGPAMLVWIVAGVVSLLGALTYAELGAMKPEAGGLYVFIRDAFGPLPAFLFGWTSFFVIASGSLAGLAIAFGEYIAQLVPVGPAASRAIAIAMLAITAMINVRGTRQSSTVQNWTSAVKIVALVSIAVALIALGRPPATTVPTWPTTITPSLASGFGSAMIAALWAYEGWQYMTFSAGEAVDPQRTFPRAITVATAALVLIYVLANLGYVAALGPDAAARSQHIAADAVGILFGGAAGRLIAVLILVSIFSASNGIMLTAPRMYFAMARDGVFFERLAVIHDRFGTPAVAVVALAAWAAALAVTGTFEQLLTYVVFTAWIFYALGALSVFALRRSEPNAVRSFRVPGYPVTPMLFVIAALLLVLNTLVAQPGRAALGLAVVLLGVPCFHVWRSASRRGAHASAP